MMKSCTRRSVRGGYALGLALVLAGAAGAQSEAKTYRMPALTLGTVNRLESDPSRCDSSATVVPDTATLAFPGLKLEDLYDEQYSLIGFSCGGFVSDDVCGAPVGTLIYQAHTNSAGVVEKAFGQMHFVEDNKDGVFTKAVTIEYTQGADGVYARAFNAQYCVGENWWGESSSRWTRTATTVSATSHRPSARVGVRPGTASAA